MSEQDNIPLEEQIRRNLELVTDGKDYSIRIDIVNRSRELADLYIQVEEFYKAIDIYLLALDLCQHTPELNNPGYFAPDIDNLVELFCKVQEKSKISELLERLISEYPDYSNISVWEKRMKNFKRGKNGL